MRKHRRLRTAHVLPPPVVRVRLQNSRDSFSSGRHNTVATQLVRSSHTFSSASPPPPPPPPVPRPLRLPSTTPPPTYAPPTRSSTSTCKKHPSLCRVLSLLYLSRACRGKRIILKQKTLPKEGGFAHQGGAEVAHLHSERLWRHRFCQLSLCLSVPSLSW